MKEKDTKEKKLSVEQELSMERETYMEKESSMEEGFSMKKAAVQTEAIAEARRKLAEMNLLDDFLFSSVVSFPGLGEQFVKILLRTIFDREFKHLSVTAQKVYYGADTDLHGARLDVYVELDKESSEERATVYDLEPDRKDKPADKKALPRRVRFYHGKIAAKNLSSGADYDVLKDVIVIMILPYDPFGLGRMIYTVKNHCVEVPTMEYEDGASTLFLYTRGTDGDSSQALKQFLRYMENSTYENAVNDDLKEVHRMIEIIKFDAETTLCCVRLTEKLERSKREGEFRQLVTQVCKKMKLGQPLEKIAEDLVEDVSAIESIYHIAGKYAPEYDTEAILNELYGSPDDASEGI